MNKKALRRIPLEKLLDLKVDFAFKQLFGSEQNKHITVVFLNAILQKTGRDNVQEIFSKITNSVENLKKISSPDWIL